MHEETLWSILSDPAHMGAEFISHIIYDLFLGLLALPLFRRYVKHEHNKIDVEHGVDNHGQSDYRIRYQYDAGTGRGDDKEYWICTCRFICFTKGAADAHLLNHKEN